MQKQQGFCTNKRSEQLTEELGDLWLHVAKEGVEARLDRHPVGRADVPSEGAHFAFGDSLRRSVLFAQVERLDFLHDTRVDGSLAEEGPVAEDLSLRDGAAGALALLRRPTRSLVDEVEGVDPKLAQVGLPAP